MNMFLKALGVTLGIGLFGVAVIWMGHTAPKQTESESLVERIAERHDFTLETMLEKYIQLTSQHRRIWGIYALNTSDEQLRIDIVRMRQVGILPPEPFTMYFHDTAFTFGFGLVTTRLIDSIDWGAEYSKEHVPAFRSDVVR